MGSGGKGWKDDERWEESLVGTGEGEAGALSPSRLWWVIRAPCYWGWNEREFVRGDLWERACERELVRVDLWEGDCGRGHMGGGLGSIQLRSEFGRDRWAFGLGRRSHQSQDITHIPREGSDYWTTNPFLLFVSSFFSTGLSGFSHNFFGSWVMLLQHEGTGQLSSLRRNFLWPIIDQHWTTIQGFLAKLDNLAFLVGEFTVLSGHYWFTSLGRSASFQHSLTNNL